MSPVTVHYCFPVIYSLRRPVFSSRCDDADQWTSRVIRLIRHAFVTAAAEGNRKETRERGGDIRVVRSNCYQRIAVGTITHGARPSSFLVMHVILLL